MHRISVAAQTQGATTMTPVRVVRSPSPAALSISAQVMTTKAISVRMAARMLSTRVGHSPKRRPSPLPRKVIAMFWLRKSPMGKQHAIRTAKITSPKSLRP
jgi:hypothetical protein